MLPKRTLLWLGALAAVLYTALALAFLRPIWEVFGDHLVPDRADPLFSLYVVKWVIHQARLGFPDLWNANIFYPAKGALAYSDPLFAQAAVISFFRNPVTGYNAVVFGSFVLTGLAVGWVLLASGVSPWGALLGGALYAFSPFRLHHLNHLAILFAPWLPLCLWSFDRFLAGCGAGRGAGRTTGRMIGRAALFLLFYALTLASGCYFAYMVHFPLLALLASRALGPPRDLLRPAALKALAPVGLLAALLLLVLFYPYWRITHQLRLDRDPSEIAGNAATLASYLSPAPQNLYSPFAPSDFWEAERLPAWQKPFVRPENTLFPGLLALPLAAWGFRAFWRRYRSPGERPSGLAWRLLSGVLLTLALLAYAAGDLYTLGLDREPALARWLPAAGPGVWLGLGLTFLGSLVLWATLRRRFRGTGVLLWREMEPWERGLVWIGGLSFLSSHALVYLPLARVVPGMSGMRVPARFAAFFGLTLVYFAARGWDALAAAWRERPPRLPAKVLVAVGLVLLLFLDLVPLPVRWVAVPPEEDFPEVYAWLAGRSDVRAVLELPMKADWRETSYMYYSTVHWKPIANGYSGFIPASYGELADAVERFLPGPEALDLLEKRGVTHLIVHPDEMGGEWRRPGAAPRLLQAWEGELGPRLAFVRDFGPDRVYRIVPRRP